MNQPPDSNAEQFGLEPVPKRPGAAPAGASSSSAAAGGSEGASPPGGAMPDPATEKELWQGRSSWKSVYPVLALWLVVTLVAGFGMWLLTHNQTALLTTLALCGLALMLLLGRTGWLIWSISYRITTQRLFIRRGILTQTLDQTELMRVEDVKVRQTLIERLLGIGQVQVFSSDRSDARLLLNSIEHPDVVSEHIRRNTRIIQKRTVFMEQL